MDQVVGGVTQRDRLVADISGLDKRTGGASYVARNPADIPTVFADALQARAQ
ncbi:hypothetical protein [Arthrobacter sp. PvP023]|nr:hypothetical protein [Arthrobacter sp. PvP023]